MLKVDRSSDYLAWLIILNLHYLVFVLNFLNSKVQTRPFILEFSGFVYYSVFNFKGTSKLAFRNAEGGI